MKTILSGELILTVVFCFSAYTYAHILPVIFDILDSIREIRYIGPLFVFFVFFSCLVLGIIMDFLVAALFSKDITKAVHRCLSYVFYWIFGIRRKKIRRISRLKL